MAIRIDRNTARRILREEVANAAEGQIDEPWARLVARLSEACASSGGTHIAFLGTALLAKAVDLRVDVFSVKARSGTAGAYSARGLCTDPLVGEAVRGGFHIGVTGREPLNNQPYFRLDRATEEAMRPLVRDPRQSTLLHEILSKLATVSTTEEARTALRSYIRVRTALKPQYHEVDATCLRLAAYELPNAIGGFVALDSEGGRRAQACAAGLLDTLYGAARVFVDRINDPDRHLPGDVGVRSTSDDDWERTFEVRDKAVNETDILVFAHKSAEAGVRTAGIIGAAANQPSLEIGEPIRVAGQLGVKLAIYLSWGDFIGQVGFWSPEPIGRLPDLVHSCVRLRLIELETRVDSVDTWDRLFVA